MDDESTCRSFRERWDSRSFLVIEPPTIPLPVLFHILVLRYGTRYISTETPCDLRRKYRSPEAIIPKGIGGKADHRQHAISTQGHSDRPRRTYHCGLVDVSSLIRPSGSMVSVMNEAG